MHASPAIVVFTVTSGAGYGLLMVLGLTQALNLGQAWQNTEVATATLVALVAISVGLASSTLHLANMKNAWRSFSRFATSWLSREAVLAVTVYPFAIIMLGLSWFTTAAGSESGALLGLSVIVALLSAATVYATAMIYGCLRTMYAWNTWLTPVNYLLIALWLGVLAALSCKGNIGLDDHALLWVGLGVGVLALIAKLLYWARARTQSGLSSGDATGLSQAAVRLLDVGHTADNFLTREFNNRVGQRSILALRTLTVAAGFVVPGLILVSVEPGMDNTLKCIAALLIAYAGLLVERVLFFIEAKHVVTLYHGATAV